MTKNQQQVSDFDEQMMRRALRAARRGHPSPNPHVGAVVVKGGQLISVGYHARCGEAHAEVMAMKRAEGQTQGATLYVTFEPCNHYGRTGPCSEAIIKAGIKRVVVGCRDPAPHVPGALERLKKAGIHVVTGVLEQQAQSQVADFTKFMLSGLPYVTLKAAVTLDGRMATRTGDSRWITGVLARREAHRLRSSNDAIMVGVGTVLADDPQLTVRHIRGRDPVRVVLDTHLRTSPKSKIINHASRAPTLLFHSPKVPQKRRSKVENRAVQLVQVPTTRKGVLNLRAVLRELARRNIVRVLCEGGPLVHGSLLDQGLADSASIFIAPRIIGDTRALPLAAGQGRTRMDDIWQLSNVQTRRLEDDILISGEIIRVKS